MYALFGFLGILLLLAGLLPIRMLPGFLRGRPRWQRRAMWVSGLIIVLIAGAFTPSDDESQQEVASNESKAPKQPRLLLSLEPQPRPRHLGQHWATRPPPHPPKQPRLLLSLEPQPRPRHLWLVSLRSIRRSN